MENSLHWVLDVTFDEDRSRIKKENAPENFGLLRRLALCLLKKESTSKRSIKGKRLRASWDEDYLRRVLCGNAGIRRRPWVLPWLRASAACSRHRRMKRSWSGRIILRIPVTRPPNLLKQRPILIRLPRQAVLQPDIHEPAVVVGFGPARRMA